MREAVLAVKRRESVCDLGDRGNDLLEFRLPERTVNPFRERHGKPRASSSLQRRRELGVNERKDAGVMTE